MSGRSDIIRRIRVRKASNRSAKYALHRLNQFLDANNPKLARILVSFWGDQQDAITYKELRKAIMGGYMTEDTFKAWQADYVAFFNSNLHRILRDACALGSREVAAAMLSGNDIYAPIAMELERWITSHGAEWVTVATEQAKEAMSSLIRYTSEGGMTVDELARTIRPTIGLTRQQAEANLRYYERIKANLLENNPKMRPKTAEKRAHEAALRYAARQHRERAQTIAETELAFAYNKGADEAVRQAVKEGLLPQMKAVWSTAADERVCSICGNLDGVSVALGDEFAFSGRTLYEGQKRTPPAHPRCRCAICYEEV